MIGDIFDSLLSTSNNKSVATPQQYGPGNPEPGGDGSGGVETKEIMQIITNCRKVLNLRAKRGERLYPEHNLFERGDLVYDMRVEEHCIVLGEKPEIESLLDQISYTSTPRMEISHRTYIVLTVSNKVNEETGKEELKTRIRYSNGHNLRLIEETNDAPSDLEKFCNHQCVMECTDECVLHKYKRNI